MREANMCELSPGLRTMLLEGALTSSLLAEDCTVWQLTAEKRWAETGRIELSLVAANPQDNGESET